MVTDIKNWSTTAGSNTSVGGVSIAEGMAPSNVNNAMRSTNAAVREWFENADWIDFGHTVTYASATTFTIASDVTSIYHANRRIRATDSSTLYGTIVSSNFSSPNTTVTVTFDAGSLSASLSAVAVGATATNDAEPRGVFASAGANSDITSITGLTTALAHTQGGTGLSALGTANQVLAVNSGATALEFQNAGGGAILQVRRKNLGYFSSTTINATTTVTGWDDTITMSSASNAILAIVGGTKTFGICVGNNLMYTYLFRDGVQTSATALNSGTVIGEIAAYFSSQNYTMSNTITFLEKPNTASAITYSVRPYGNTAGQQSSAMTWSNTHLTLIELDGSLVTINP